jgi:hypothetical protein
VYGYVGLCDGQNTGYPLGTELVEGLANNMGSHVMSSPQQRISDMVKVVKKLGITFLKL